MQIQTLIHIQITKNTMPKCGINSKSQPEGSKSTPIPKSSFPDKHKRNTLPRRLENQPQTSKARKEAENE